MTTWLYHDSTTIKALGDLSTKYWPGQIVWITQGTQEKFFKVVSISIDSGYTLIELDGRGVYEVTNSAIDSAKFTASIFAPQGMPPDLFDPVITSLDNDVTQVDGKYIATDKVRARDGDGLLLENDHGVGIKINDNNTIHIANGNLYIGTAATSRGGIFLHERATGWGEWIDWLDGNGTDSRARIQKDANDSLIFRAGGVMSDDMILSGLGDLWVRANCSAESFTDRSKFPTGIDALAAIRPIKGDGKGELDHASLPDCVRVRAQKDIFEERDVLDENGQPKRDETGQKITEQVKVGEEIEEGRDLGAMVSLLTKGLQEATARIEALESKLEGGTKFGSEN